MYVNFIPKPCYYLEFLKDVTLTWKISFSKVYLTESNRDSVLNVDVASIPETGTVLILILLMM